MENIQIFKIQDVQNEPQNLSVYVNYDIEGSNVETWIRYEDIAAFIAECYPKKVYKALSGLLKQEVNFEPEDVANLDDESLIRHVHSFLWKNLNIALRIENRKLRDKNEDLEKRLKSAKTGALLIKATITDTFLKYKYEALESNTERSLGELTMIRHALYHAQKVSEWFQINVFPDEDITPNHIRKSA